MAAWVPSGISPPRTLMAEFDQYFNYPTFPGLGPWTPTLYERSLSSDYAISDTNLPANSFSTRLDILSDEYPVGGWLGVVIPLPSALSAVYTYSTIITITGKYWNWLNYGFFLNTISQSDSERSMPRPATFHYQMGDKYKEVAHYGYDMMLYAIVMSTGRIAVTNIVSFVPFMEHRHQCAMAMSVLQAGSISSSRIDIKSRTATVTVAGVDTLARPRKSVFEGGETGFGNLSMLLYWESTDASTGNRIFNNRTFKVVEITSSSNFVLDASGYAEEIDKGLFPDFSNAFFLFDRPVQIVDPQVLYGETQFGREHIVRSSSGYTTREQAVEYTTDSWRSVYYDAELLSSFLLQHEEEAKGVAESSTDEAAVAQAQKDAARYRAESAAVLSGSAVYDGKHAAEKGAVVTTDGVDVVVSDVVIREYAEMEVSSLTVGFDVIPTTLSRHNYGPETQVGNYFLFTKAGGATFSAYKIIVHGRSGVFTLSVASANSLSTLFSDMKEDGGYRIMSQKLWKTVDICTGKSGVSAPTNTSMDRGIFDLTVKSGSVSPGDVGGSGKIILECELSDRNYYTAEYLKSRFVDDIQDDDSVSGPVKAWVKFGGWRLNRQGSEYSSSLAIEKVEMDGVAVRITLSSVAPVGGKIDASDYSGSWWISFGPLFSFNRPFNYISTPFIGMNAFLTETGSDAKLLFNGIYVGSPLSMELKRDASIRLIEDFPGIFPRNISGVDYSMIKISTSRGYRYIAHSKDDDDDAEYILYERDDDASKALVVRAGRIGFTHGVNEFLVHHSSNYGEVEASLSGTDGATAQTMSAAPLSVKDRDVVAILTRKSDPNGYPKDVSGKYSNTLWRVYQSDRLIGIDSTSGNENSIFTRASGKGVVSGVQEIPFYANAEYFSGNDAVEYMVAGNTATGDPLAGDGSKFRFVPVLNGNAQHAKIASAGFRTVPSNLVVRNAMARRVFTSRGKHLVCIEQPQWSYLGSVSSSISDVTIVPGTENKDASQNVPPPPSMVSVLDNGVFVLNTSDSFRTYSSGVFSRNSRPDAEGLNKATMWKYPLLVAPNLAQCSFYRAGDIDMVGYSKITDSKGNETTAIVHCQVNMVNTFAKPVFSFNSNGRTAFLWSDAAVSRNIFAAGISTDEIEPSFVISDLAVYPLAIASTKKYKFLILRIGTALQWAMSSDIGKKWSFYDDLFLTAENRTASSPSVEIYGDWLYMCYIADKTELRIKKISIPSLTKFHTRYIDDKVSSGDKSEAIDKIKQDLQVELDNMFDTKIVDTFDQQVSFSICGNGEMRVVFYDSKGLVNAASSTTEGASWNLSPVNF